MSYDVYWVKNRAEKIADFEHPTLQGAWGCMAVYPGRCPGLWRTLGFQPVLVMLTVMLTTQN